MKSGGIPVFLWSSGITGFCLFIENRLFSERSATLLFLRFLYFDIILTNYVGLSIIAQYIQFSGKILHDLKDFQWHASLYVQFDSKYGLAALKREATLYLLGGAER